MSVPRLSVVLLPLLGLACGGPSTPTLFRSVPASESGIDFRNDLTEAPGVNILEYLYFYDGGGVGIGDFNGDGLMDIFLTANQGSNRLFENQGDFRFKDVTDKAGVSGTGDWTKGVAVADVNGDGLSDIYVTNVNHEGLRGRNELFINRGEAVFDEVAEDYGLAFSGLATHATFFDYDLDGDLDVYLVNHSTHKTGVVGGAVFRSERSEEAGDRLLRNEDGRFLDVTEQAGIRSSFLGYGLAVGTSDLDRDGCADLYVSNDFHENDYLYYNNCDGTFTESVVSAMGHTSRSSMGNDIADLNGDGWTDIVVADMLPPDAQGMRAAVSFEDHEIYRAKVGVGFHHQDGRNTLQLNRQGRHFSEVARYAGIEATDWTWAVLAADYDLDGRTDLFMTNGILRRPNDRDYLRWISTPEGQQLLVGGPETLRQALDRLPSALAANVAYRNEGAIRFSDQSVEWGLAALGASTGAAYADLDNDGDLDLVVNSVDAEVLVYQNTVGKSVSHGLGLALESPGKNSQGVGARVTAFFGDGSTVLEQYASRGWASSVDPRLFFGVGHLTRVDSVQVKWPDRTTQTLLGLPVDTVLVVQKDSRAPPDPGDSMIKGQRARRSFTAGIAPPFIHEENEFSDFSREPLIPHLLSAEGPALAVGDVNGDGLDDAFVGGAKWQAAGLFLQNPDGSWRPTGADIWRADSLFEDVDAAFFDADRDGDLDLYVASGGNEFWGQNRTLLDRLYRNDGSGGFVRDLQALPEGFQNSCCVRPSDYDRDGDIDLFVGARVVSRQYAVSPRSRLLENDGSGNYQDVTDRIAPDLVSAGMLTDASWADLTGDGNLDLVVVGDWMPPRLFAQSSGRFVEQTQEAGLSGLTGLWQGVATIDADEDGDQDLIAGNLGLNGTLVGSEDDPVMLHIGDFDRNGSPDPFVSFLFGGVRIPFGGREALLRQMPALVTTFSSNADYSISTVDAVLGDTPSRSIPVMEHRSLLLRNDGAGRFAVEPLPAEAQLFPISSVLEVDRLENGGLVLLLAGNFTGVSPRRGRLDAGWGILLEVGSESLSARLPEGLYLGGQVQALRAMDGPGSTFLAAVNDAPVLLYRYEH